MLPFKLVYSDGYYLPIGEHVFPAEKYRRIKQRLLEAGIAGPEDFLVPEPATDFDVHLVHASEYVHKLQTGTLSAREELEMEIPFSHELVDAFWLAAGGTILAAQRALEDRVGINLGGGFHHAFPDHGEGFCMIHDVAIAVRRLQKDKKITRAMTIDCDVHQGNGTAIIFRSRRAALQPLPSTGAPTLEPIAGVPHPSPVLARVGVSSSSSQGPSQDIQDAPDVFTISLHQENNYPAWKPPSSIDVNLPDGIGDEQYLAWLDNAVSSALRQFQPDLLCYLAGADPSREEQLGGLNLSIDGLKKRDEFVFRVARTRSIPVMVTLAGGYARKVEDTVTIHCNTVVAAGEVFG